MQNVKPGAVITLTAGSYTVTNNSNVPGEYGVAENNPPIAVDHTIPPNTTQSFTINADGGQFENRGTPPLSVNSATPPSS